MRRKENMTPNAQNTSTYLKNVSRKHSALGIQQANDGKHTSRQFKPRFILKTKETPTNVRCTHVESSTRQQQAYEYDEGQDAYRKFDEEHHELQRLRRLNRQYRGNILRMNHEYQLVKQRNKQLQASFSGSNIPQIDREAKFTTTIASVTSILSEVSENLSSGGKKDILTAQRKIQQLLSCLHMFAHDL